MTVSYSDKVLEPVPDTITDAGKIYTLAGFDRGRITFATAFNTNTVGVLITGYIVQSGGTSLDKNKYVSRIVPDGRSIDLFELVGASLESGDFIQFVAAEATSISVKMTIEEVTF